MDLPPIIKNLSKKQFYMQAWVNVSHCSTNELEKFVILTNYSLQEIDFSKVYLTICWFQKTKTYSIERSIVDEHYMSLHLQSQLVKRKHKLAPCSRYLTNYHHVDQKKNQSENQICKLINSSVTEPQATLRYEASTRMDRKAIYVLYGLKNEQTK